MFQVNRKLGVSTIFATVLSLLVWNAAQADKSITKESAQALVQPFYDFLSGKANADEAFANMADDWRSYSSDTEHRSQEATTKAIGGLRKHIAPDLSWAIHDVIVNDDYIVIRGEGSGTPIADFLGVPPSGKSFAVMSIDVHKIIDGKIASTWHVENWADAIRQLNPN